jgi:hypothetical protein
LRLPRCVPCARNEAASPRRRSPITTQGMAAITTSFASARCARCAAIATKANGPSINADTVTRPTTTACQLILVTRSMLPGVQQGRVRHRRKAMGPYLQVSFDHIWPGAAESCFARVDPERRIGLSVAKAPWPKSLTRSRPDGASALSAARILLTLLGWASARSRTYGARPRRHRSAFRFAGAALLRRKRCRVWRRWLWRR